MVSLIIRIIALCHETNLASFRMRRKPRLGRRRKFARKTRIASIVSAGYTLV